MIAASLAMSVTLVIALAWRSVWAPAVGGIAGVVVAIVTGAAGSDDVTNAAHDLWRPLVTLIGIMTTTSTANRLGVFGKLAAWIEPRTRGPVKYAFRMVFALSALTAAILSNDAAILMFTPVVLELLKQVYPRRNPKFLVPFAFAVFVAAGVAPLPTSNPMNLVVSSKAGIAFNAYAIHMIPVAIVGWLAAYLMLAWFFRDSLSDEAPALGRMKTATVFGTPQWIVLWITIASVASYPLLAGLGQPLWVVAGPSAVGCLLAARRGGITVRQVASGVSWELFPFLFGVLVMATAFAHTGATAHLTKLYLDSPFPMPTVTAFSAAGSALIDNHPMALLQSIALHGAPDRLVYAALVGGDLGPRFLPIGSLAGLLWLHELRRGGVVVPLGTFVKVGFIVTIPSIIASLVMLWAVT
jgi:arsenical pump membrane protein